MPRFARFLVVGTLNTAASYFVYLLLLPVADYRVAYTVAYIAGLAGGYWANARFVFGAVPRMATLTGYLFCYGATYVVSLAVLWGVVAWGGVIRPLAMLAALAVAVPLSYALLRINFAQRPAPNAKRQGTGIE
jgi:putative flippase GtrA